MALQSLMFERPVIMLCVCVCVCAFFSFLTKYILMQCLRDKYLIRWLKFFLDYSLKFHTFSLSFFLSLFFLFNSLSFSIFSLNNGGLSRNTVERYVRAFLWMEGSTREASTLDVMTSIPQSFPLLARWINVTSTAIEPAYSKVGSTNPPNPGRNALLEPFSFTVWYLR